MKNKHSSSGAGEDLLRAIAQLGASEMHLKTLYEKTLAELENGFIKVEDPEVLEKHREKLEDYKLDIEEVAMLRRKAMLALYNEFEGKGDKDAWCLVKHLTIANICAFEAWQASDDDPELLDLSVQTNKQLVRAVTRFVGAEISDCAACLSDFFKAKGVTEDESIE